MSDPDPRRLLETGVGDAALMQVATLGEGGSPTLCHVWFQASFGPDRLFFLSRSDRDHAVNIRKDPRVAGAIALDVPAGLGERVRGVTLTGLAREIPKIDRPDAAAAFVRRWPAAAEILAAPSPRPASLRANFDVPKPSRSALALAPRSRLYEIAVAQWVLFDEVNFPDEPKLTLPAG
jgi:Pyridoxamine 5'-phosphate oxidase